MKSPVRSTAPGRGDAPALRGTLTLVRVVGDGKPITPEEAQALSRARLGARSVPGGDLHLTKKGLRLLASLIGAEERSTELRARAQAEARQADAATQRAFAASLPYRND